METFKKVRNIWLFVFLFPMTLFGQKGVEDGSKYGHGEDSIRCIRALTFSREFVKTKEYSIALPHWKIIFDECPLSTENIYIDGAKMYKDFLKDADTEERINELLDTLMLIYDRRIEYFGKKGNVRGRQGVDLLRYGRDQLDNIERAYHYLKESVELRDLKATDAVLASYFSCSLVLYDNAIIDIGQIMSDYLVVSDLLDRLIENEPDEPEWQELKKSIDINFDEQGPDNCQEITDYFEPQFSDKKSDPEFLDLAFAMMESKRCTDSEFYYEVITQVEKANPSAALSEKIAKKAFREGDYARAIEYYDNAARHDSIENNKADYYYGIAACYQLTNNKPLSRDFARKAINIRPSWGEPYILIGLLYADSYDLCSSLSLPKAVYWVAVDMFEKARSVDPTAEEKARSLINMYSQYYPSEDDAFFLGIKAGDKYPVDCWINETTRARF